jgi:hypothetical protein
VLLEDIKNAVLGLHARMQVRRIPYVIDRIERPSAEVPSTSPRLVSQEEDLEDESDYDTTADNSVDGSGT